MLSRNEQNSKLWEYFNSLFVDTDDINVNYNDTIDFIITVDNQKYYVSWILESTFEWVFDYEEAKMKLLEEADYIDIKDRENLPFEIREKCSKLLVDYTKNIFSKLETYAKENNYDINNFPASLDAYD